MIDHRTIYAALRWWHEGRGDADLCAALQHDFGGAANRPLRAAAAAVGVDLSREWFDAFKEAANIVCVQRQMRLARTKGFGPVRKKSFAPARPVKIALHGLGQHRSGGSVMSYGCGSCGGLRGLGQLAPAPGPISPGMALAGVAVGLVGLTVLGGLLAEKHQRALYANRRPRRKAKRKARRRVRRNAMYMPSGTRVHAKGHGPGTVEQVHGETAKVRWDISDDAEWVPQSGLTLL